MTYDADNRLLTYNGQNVEYDAEGNMTKGPLNGDMAEFSYDCRNRLVKVKEADGTVTTYEYDAENVRTAKVTGGVRTEYTTDRESTYSQVLVKKEYEKNVFGLYTEQKIQTVYTYGTGLVSERRDGGEKFYYHYNHLGSTMAVSDKGGNVVYRFVYDTYGELSDIQNGNRISLQTAEEAQEYTLTELANAAGIEYLYNGKYGVTTDSNGLYYMRARYYNQDVKRFINRDILSGDITNSQSMNRYCYVQGNPVSLTDPFGLCPTAEEIRKIELRGALHKTLDVIGIFFDGADVLNAIIYALEGDNVNAALCLLFFIPGVGSAVGLTVKYAFKIGGNAGEALAKFVKKYAPELAENGGRLISNVGGKLDDAGKWISKKIEKIFAESSLDTTNRTLISGEDWYKYFQDIYGAENVVWESKESVDFATERLRYSHYIKHRTEFKGLYNSEMEYLEGARDVINNGYVVNYEYKGETRVGYIRFIGNDSKGNAKFAFVGTNNYGNITTFHTESGKSFWKMLNNENIPVINPQ